MRVNPSIRNRTPFFFPSSINLIDRLLSVSRALVAFLALGVAACGADSSGVFLNESGVILSAGGLPPARATKISGDAQIVRVGERIPSHLVVRIEDEYGGPLKGVPVTWAVTSGGGRLSSSQSVTDSEGLASQSTWQLGVVAGLQHLAATAGTLDPIVFSVTAEPGPPATGAVSPDSLVTWVGATAELVSSFSDQWGNRVTGGVSWSSQNPSIVSMTPHGSARALSPGTTRVIASLGSVQTFASVRVRALPPVLVQAVGPVDREAPVGQALPDPLVLEVLDATGGPSPGVEVMWSVADGSGSLQAVDSVTGADGRADAVFEVGHKAGRSTIEATVRSLGTVEFDVTGSPGPVDSVQVTPAVASLFVGEELGLEGKAWDAFRNPVDASLTWRSRNQAVARVAPDGTVRGEGHGVTVILGELNGRADSLIVTVRDTSTVVLLKVAGDEQTHSAGATLPDSLKVRAILGTGLPAAGVPISWTVVAGDGGSVEPSQGETDREGLASVVWTLGPAEGTQRVEASVEGADPVGFSAYALADSPVSLQLSPASLELVPDQVAFVSAMVRDRAGNLLADRPFSWTIAPETVARVDQAGKVTALAVGTAVLTATTAGISGSAVVNVVPTAGRTRPGTVNDLEVVSVTDRSATLRWTEVDDGTGAPADYALRFGSPVLDWGKAYGTEKSVQGQRIGSSLEFTWQGLTPLTRYEFRLVSYRGVLNENASFGELSGTVTATTDTSGAGTPSQVTVHPPDGTVLYEGQSRQFSATVRDEAGAVIPSAVVTWTSTDSTVASVSRSGLVQGMDPGAANIRAEWRGFIGESKVFVQRRNPALPAGTPFFDDGFESGDFSKRGGSTGRNFRWGTAHVYNSDLIARSGSRSARVRYMAADDPENPDNDAWAALFFTMDPISPAKVWVEYYVYFPDGSDPRLGAAFYHRKQSSGGDQQKYFRVYANPYIDGPSVGFDADNALDNGANEIAPVYRDKNDVLWGAWKLNNHFVGLGGVGGTAPYGAIARGRWVQFRFQFEEASSSTSEDGVIKMWVDGELEWGSDQVPLWAGDGKHFFDAGYIFNHANAGFDEETWVFVDDVKFFDTDPGW